MTETVIETATGGMFAIATVTTIAGLISVMMTAALVAMTDGVIGTIGVTIDRCTGTVTAGVTNLVQ